jgi:hypothetical protein
MRESSKPGRLSSYGRAGYLVINCGQGTDTATIDVVYNGTTITTADKVSDCETVKDQNGQVVDQTQLP